MTNNLKTKLTNSVNTGTKKEVAISRQLLQNPEIHFKNLKSFATIFKCSHSSVTRYSRSLGFPSFKHFFYEYLEEEKTSELRHENNDILYYKEEAQKLAKIIKGKLFIFTSRRGKSIGKFLHERLNSAQIPNEYHHESWGKTIEEKIEQITTNDSSLIISMNAESFLATKTLNLLKEAKNVQQIIFLTASLKKINNKKVHPFSLSKIDKIKYNLDSFHDYNFACARMIAFIVTFLKEAYDQHQNNL